MAVDGVLFIDSNLYLDLYRTATGTKLLAPLAEQQEHIFITEQVVNEVLRNKVQVATEFLKTQFAELSVRNFKIPDHLIGTETERTSALSEQLCEIRERIARVNDTLAHQRDSLLHKINRSDDRASRVLAPIFSKAVSPTEKELQRAKSRKELGLPPGKKSDPIGDELNWEQLVSACNGKSGLWILSRDDDYSNNIGGTKFINPALLDDICRRCNPQPAVHCFEYIPDGIQHFAKTFGLDAKELPSAREVEEIKIEQEGLPTEPRIISEPDIPFASYHEHVALLAESDKEVALLAAELKKAQERMQQLPNSGERDISAANVMQLRAALRGAMRKNARLHAIVDVLADGS